MVWYSFFLDGGSAGGGGPKGGGGGGGGNLDLSNGIVEEFPLLNTMTNKTSLVKKYF